MSEARICAVKRAREEAEKAVRNALRNYLCEEGAKTAAEIAKENDMSVAQVRGLIVHTQCNTRYDGSPRVRVVDRKSVIKRYVLLKEDNSVDYDNIIKVKYSVNVYGIR